MLCYLFYKTQLVPRFLGVWGLIGYATILGGSVLEILGFNLNSIHTIPGGLWELFIGVWLIAKGFSPVPPGPRACGVTDDAHHAFTRNRRCDSLTCSLPRSKVTISVRGSRSPAHVLSVRTESHRATATRR